MSFRHSIFFICSCFFIADWVVAEEVLLAVASNFSTTMKKLETAYEKKHEHYLTITYASSGKHYAQIINGAPFQVFLSADQETPMRLVEDELAVKNSQFSYAFGRLVLWTNIESLRGQEKVLLEDRNYRNLSIANPKLAPYGKAAVDVLNNLNIKQDESSRWVYGENIGQSFQFVATKNAELGFVGLSQVLALSPKDSFWYIPEALYDPIQQDAVLLKRGKDSLGARDFLEFMHTDIAQNIICQSGYRIPKKC